MFQENYVNFKDLDLDSQELIKESVKMRNFAYCPYSNFRVGAALQCDSGLIYTGCNVENASFGLTICAEKTAVVKAVSSGDLKIRKIAVCANSEKGLVSPCGSCRQFLSEFNKDKDNDMIVYLTNVAMDKIIHTSVKELLPLAFGLL